MAPRQTGLMGGQDGPPHLSPPTHQPRAHPSGTEPGMTRSRRPCPTAKKPVTPSRRDPLPKGATPPTPREHLQTLPRHCARQSTASPNRRTPGWPTLDDAPQRPARRAPQPWGAAWATRHAIACRPAHGLPGPTPPESPPQPPPLGTRGPYKGLRGKGKKDY